MNEEGIISTTAPATMEDKLLTLAQVRERLQIGRTKLWNIISAGEMKRIKHGRIVRVRVSEVERWLECHTGNVGDGETDLAK